MPPKMAPNGLYYGSASPDILFIVDPVIARRDDDTIPVIKQPLNNRQLTYLTALCKKHNIPINKAAILGACPPVSMEVWENARKLTLHLKEHREAFANVIKTVNPMVIVPLGKSSASQVFNRPVQITKVRGVPVRNEEFNCISLPSLGVAHVIRIPDNASTFESDIETLSKIVAKQFSMNYQDKIKQEYKWVTDLQFIIDKINEEGELVLAVDTEYTNGEWYDKSQKLLTVQLCYEPGVAYAIPIDYSHKSVNWRFYNKPDHAVRTRVARQLKQILEDKRVRVVGQNYKGDYHVLRERLNIRTANYEDDTILLAHNVDENIKNKALSELTRLYVKEMAGYSDLFDKDPIHVGKTRMDKAPPHKMLMYGCADTDATFRLRERLLTLAKKDLKNYQCYRKVVMPAQRALCENEVEGFHIDINALRRFENKLKAHQESEKIELLKLVPPSIRKEHYTDFKKPSLTRQGFLLQMLFDHPDGLKLEPIIFTKGSKNNKDKTTRIPSTSTKDHLPYFKDNPFVARLIKYTKNEKLLTTYVGTERDDKDKVTGFYKYIRNGKVRPSYLLHRAVTGRSTSVNPNGQNFPKRGEFAKEYREIFVAPPGHVLLQVDYSQIELRIAAMMANDPYMLKLFRDGVDIHTATAANVMGITLEAFKRLPQADQQLARFRAKAVNFGFLYGMGWRKFIIYAKTEYGIEYTEEEAQRIRYTFFRTYRNLGPWHNKVKEYVRANGYVRAYDGRTRHLPSIFSPDEPIAQGAERQSVNSPVQGFGSDLGLMAMALINANVDKKLVRAIGFIHDSIICIAPKDRAVEATKVIKYWMEHVPLKKLFNFEPTIPIIAEAEIGQNLSKTIEIEQAWLDNPLVKNYEHIKYLDWERRVSKAKQLKIETPSQVGTKPGLLAKRKIILRRKVNGNISKNIPNPRRIIVRR